MDTEQTSNEEGTAVPTPPTDMSTTSQTPVADQPVESPQAEAKSPEVLFAEEALGREFSSKEEAQKALKNLNSMVGDQTIAKLRKTAEHIAKQSGLSTDELYEVLENQAPTEVESVNETTQQPVQLNLASDASKRLTRLELDEVVKNDPDAAAIRDTLFAESLSTGRPAGEIWQRKYKPLIDIGKKSGVEQLRKTNSSQPVKATSTTSHEEVKIDPNKLSLTELEQLIPKGKGF